MAINATMDGTTYNGVSAVTATDGSTTKTITLSESGVIDTPTATKTIDQNGTYDVLNFASAIVNIQSGGGSSSASGSFQVSEDTFQKTINTGLATVHGLILWTPVTTTSDSIRGIALILIDTANNFFATVGENNNHTQLWSTVIAKSSSRLRYTINGGDISMTTADENGSGYFAAEYTYQWVAW